MADEEEERRHGDVSEAGGQAAAEEEADQDDENTSSTRLPIPEHIRMHLPEPELSWARAIKEMVEATPELDNLPDYWYASLALVDHDKHEQSMERVQAMQNFKEEYAIRHEVSEGIMYISKLMRLFPRHYLSFDFHKAEVPGVDDAEGELGGNYIMAVDLTALYMKDFVHNPEAMKIFCCSAYYLLTAMNPDLESVRQGAYMLAECEGFDWRRNYDVSAKRQLWGNLVTVYPFNICYVKHYHNTMFINLLMSVAKRFIPREIHETMEFGCVNPSPDGKGHQRLDELYLQPTVEMAQLKMLARLKEALQIRMANEKSFRL